MLYVYSFILVLLRVTSTQSQRFSNLPNAYSQPGLNITNSSCTATDFRVSFPACDTVFENLNGASATTAIYYYFRTNLASGVTTAFAALDQLCKSATAYTQCISNLLGNCQPGTQTFNVALKSQASSPCQGMTTTGGAAMLCNGDGTVMQTLSQVRSTTDVTNCLTGMKLNRVLAALDSLFASVPQAAAIYDQTLPSNAPAGSGPPGVTISTPNANQTNSFMALCNKFIDYKRQIAIELSTCTATVIAAVQNFSSLILPPDIATRCAIPQNVAAPTFKNNDASRTTVVVFGGFNKINISATVVETCTYNDGSNVSLLILPQLTFTCTIHLLNSASSYGYFNQCEIIFWDANRNIIDTLEFMGTGTLIPTTFSINGGQILSSASGAGGGKPALKITLNTTVTNTAIIIDANSGLVIYVSVFSSSVSKANIYSVVLRVSANAFNQVPNEFSHSCVNPIALSSSGSTGRRKRDASTVSTSAASQYDVTNNNDQAAANMATNAQSQAASAASMDSTLTNLISGGGGSGSSWKEPLVTLVGLSAMLVFLVMH